MQEYFCKERKIYLNERKKKLIEMPQKGIREETLYQIKSRYFFEIYWPDVSPLSSLSDDHLLNVGAGSSFSTAVSCFREAKNETVIITSKLNRDKAHKNKRNM